MCVLFQKVKRGKNLDEDSSKRSAVITSPNVWICVNNLLARRSDIDPASAVLIKKCHSLDLAS